MNTTLTIVMAIAVCLTLIATALTYVFLQNKIKNSDAEYKHQMLNLRHELITKTNEIDLAAYMYNEGKEIIVYNSDNGDLKKDFAGHSGRVWDYTAHEFADGYGQGSLEIKDGVITLYRTNDLGRYELQLNSYAYNNSPDKIPANNSVTARNFRLSFQVKRGDSSQLLRFVFKGETSHEALDEKQYVVFHPGWEQVNLAFTIPANEPSFLRMDDIQSEAKKNKLQLRNIRLFEKQ